LPTETNNTTNYYAWTNLSKTHVSLLKQTQSIVRCTHDFTVVITYPSHTGTVVPECYKDDVESLWKNLVLNSQQHKTCTCWTVF